MTKTNKLMTSMIAMAIMLMGNLQGWAQAAKTQAGKAKEEQLRQPPSIQSIASASGGGVASQMDELAKIKSNPSDPYMETRIVLWQAKSELSAAQSKNASSEQISRLQENVTAIEAKLNKLDGKDKIDMAAEVKSLPSVITRQEFMLLSDLKQRAVVENPNSIRISDLVSLPAEDMNKSKSGFIYISKADFMKAETNIKIKILKTPDVYKISN